MQSACTMTSPPPDPSAKWKESLESFLIDCTQIQMDEKLGEGKTDRHMDEQVDRQTDGWTDRWMGGQTD